MADIELTLSVEEKKALRALTKLTKSADKFGDEAEKSFKKADKTFSIFAGNLAANLATKAFSLLANSAVAAIGAIVDKTIEFEQIETRFITLLGSTKRAQESLQDLQEFAAKTPFELPGIADSAAQLLAFGFAQDQIIPKLQQLGDVAAGSGSDLKEVSLIFGQVAAAGKLTGERLLQFQERAIPIGPAIARTMGIAESAVKDAVSAGQVDLAIFEEAFSSLSAEGGLFFEGMDRQSKTLGGTLSTLDDSIGILATEIGKVFLPALRDSANLLIEVTDATTNFVKELSKTVDASTATEEELRKVVPAQIAAALAAGAHKDALEKLNNAYIENGEAFKLNNLLQLDSVQVQAKSINIIEDADIASKELAASLLKEAAAAKALQEEREKLAKAGEQIAQRETEKADPSKKFQREVDALNAANELKKISIQDFNIAVQELEAAEDERKLARDEAEFQRLTERNQLLKDVDAEKFAAEIKANEDAQKKILDRNQQTSNFVLKVKRDQAKKEAEIEKAKIAFVVQNLQNLQSLSAFSGRTNFEIAKAAGVAQATILGAQAVQQALASAPPPFNFVLAATTGIQAAANIRKIATTQLATGIDSVPGTGTADNFPALLAPGERVVPTKTNQDLTEFLASTGSQTQLLQNIADRLDNINPVAMVQIGNQDILTAVNDAVDEGGTLAS